MTLTSSLHTFPENAEVISALHPSRPRDVSLVQMDGERYVLKRKTPPKGRVKQWRARWFGSGEIRHEARVYRALEKVAPEHFRTPRLIASDEKTFLLLEYTPSDPGRATDTVSLASVGRAIAEFQRLPLVFERQPLRHTLHRHHVMYGISRYARHLSQVLPADVARKCLGLAFRLHRQQSAMPHFLITHNDLNPGNLAPGADGTLILLDFASVAYTRRWLFGDVTAYGFNPKLEWWIAPALVAAYVSALEKHQEFEEVRPDTQLRMALLLRVPHWMLFRSRKSKPYPRALEFIMDVLLDDDAYATWYAGLMAEGRKLLAENR